MCDDRDSVISISTSQIAALAEKSEDQQQTDQDQEQISASEPKLEPVSQNG